MRTVAKINAFLYYNCKDSKGFNCEISGDIWKDVNEVFKNNEKDYNEHKERIAKLTSILKKHSDENSVIGIYYVKGKKVKCNGKSYEDTIISKQKSKNPNKRYKYSNNKYNNNRNSSRNSNYNKKSNSNNNNKRNSYHNNYKNKKYYKRNNNNQDKQNYKKKYDDLLNKIKNNTDNKTIISELEKEQKAKEEQSKPDF